MIGICRDFPIGCRPCHTTLQRTPRGLFSYPRVSKGGVRHPPENKTCDFEGVPWGNLRENRRKTLFFFLGNAMTVKFSKCEFYKCRENLLSLRRLLFRAQWKITSDYDFELRFLFETLSFLSLFFFWKKARKTTQKTRIFYPHRTPKILGNKGKNTQKNKEFLAREKNKEIKKARKGRTGKWLLLREFLRCVPAGHLRQSRGPPERKLRKSLQKVFPGLLALSLKKVSKRSKSP